MLFGHPPLRAIAMKTDQQLQQSVIDELTWDPSVHASQIGVIVKDGVVTLDGEVSSYGEKWGAERAAQRVSGVQALAVGLQVKLSALGQRSDSDIARSAQTALHWCSTCPSDSIQLMVENGWITLTGTVEWHFQKQAAVDALRYLIGVTGVSDQIAISPKTQSNAVKSDIEAALKRRATSEAQEIHVDVHGADVTLSGTVHSWAERELARHSAWGTKGVRQVVDNMAMAH
jgi:osmotically-inducible protein OsmY